MKLRKKLLGLLSVVCVCATFVLSSSVAEAKETDSYTYTVRIRLADADTNNDGKGEAGAYFITDSTGQAFCNDEALVVYGASDKTDIAFDGDCLSITGLDYGAQVTFNTSKAVGVTADENNYSKYYAKGIRQSGSNDPVSKATFSVTKDVDYVIAYGVGKIVPYKVRYVDADGKELAPEETLYGPEGEAIYVSYKYIPGYVPNTYNYLTQKLAGPVEGEDGTLTYTVFEFKYEPGTTETGTTETIYRRGGVNYIYVTVPGQTTVITTGGNGNGGNGNGGNAGQGGQAEGAADNNDADQAAGGDTNATIGDDETPTSGPEDVISIDDEETAKSGGAKDFVFPLFAWIIVAIAVATIIALVVIFAKRKPKKAVNIQTNEDKTQK